MFHSAKVLTHSLLIDILEGGPTLNEVLVDNIMDTGITKSIGGIITGHPAATHPPTPN
jgi:hypothetical protein